ncbi:MAG TPA: Hsp20 family protein [Bacilli bacterium]|nr:Hsp20 family protein [Bacilli bacterium]
MLFGLDFDKEFYRFTRNLKDMYPYEIVRKDNRATIIHNVVGLSKDDIKISLEREGKIDYLVISGEKKNEITDKIYKVDSRFTINVDEITEEGIEWEVKDGLLYVYITFKKPEKPSIKIKYKK